MRIVLTVLVEGSLAEHLATVLDQRLTKLLGESVILSSLDGRVVDGVLHVVDLWTQEGQSRGRGDEGGDARGQSRHGS